MKRHCIGLLGCGTVGRDEGLTFAEALACAQERGFAEADPRLDVSGEDAAQKLRILAELAFDAPVRRTTVVWIEGITAGIVATAKSRGRVIRSVAAGCREAWSCGSSRGCYGRWTTRWRGSGTRTTP